jgi:hypothetical protein
LPAGPCGIDSHGWPPPSVTRRRAGSTDGGGGFGDDRQPTTGPAINSWS